MTQEQYDADYFLRGKATGKSLYEDYRWMPGLTIPMVRSMISHLGIANADMVLDFGCARGYVVRAFRELGYLAYGYDTSPPCQRSRSTMTYSTTGSLPRT